MAHAFVLIMAVMVFVNVLVYVCMHPILWFLRVPQEVMEGMQQSVMNFGILMVQGLVNSFGATTMAAFAAAVKIDTFAYLPVQDFGNAYSTFVAQNYGVKDYGRIQKRNEGSLCDQYCIQYHYFHSGVHVCSISDGDFCEGTGDGGHRVWCAVSAYRGLVLLWNRVSVSAVRILPGNQQSTDVSGAYGDLSGAACCVGLYPFGAVESPGNLGGNSDWMGGCRCDRTLLHEMRESQKFKRNLIRRQKIPCYNEPVRM